MNQQNNHTLSKSSFIRGRQCLKSLYLKKNFPDLEDKISESQQAIFTKGTDIGKLAQQLFPGGVDLGIYIPSDFDRVFSETSRLISEGQAVIYEAGFKWNNLICFVDILVKIDGKWYAYEVKGSTSVSEVYLWDAAFQYDVITSSGFELEDFFIIHINNQYIRRGTLDLQELFIKSCVTENVISLQKNVVNDIVKINFVLNSGSVPQIDIGPQCDSPYYCSFRGHCWCKVPDYSIFNINRLSSKKKFELYRMGIINIKDVPEDFPLTENQQLQVYSEKTGCSKVDLTEIRKFLENFHYPLYFLDFETFQPAIPLFDESRPYQQIVFQYSLHILKHDEELIHKEFLAGIDGDPRIGFLKKLMDDLGEEGDIVVYNKSFEITRLKELARDFPSYKQQIDSIISRISDLMTPFSSKHYYMREMQGSYSIKSVLPALVPQLSYKLLEIDNGGLASMAFERLYFETDEEIINKTRQDLLEYCKLDTLAMVEILKVLQKV